jgi:hypothetical protein
LSALAGLVGDVLPGELQLEQPAVQYVEAGLPDVRLVAEVVIPGVEDFDQPLADRLALDSGGFILCRSPESALNNIFEYFYLSPTELRRI